MGWFILVMVAYFIGFATGTLFNNVRREKVLTEAEWKSIWRSKDKREFENEYLNVPYTNPHWECMPDKENTETEGWYRVRWSDPDEQGRYQWAAHYPYEPNGHSKGWAENAAERTAKRWNEERKPHWC